MRVRKVESPRLRLPPSSWRTFSATAAVIALGGAACSGSDDSALTSAFQGGSDAGSDAGHKSETTLDAAPGSAFDAAGEPTREASSDDAPAPPPDADRDDAGDPSDAAVDAGLDPTLDASADTGADVLIEGLDAAVTDAAPAADATAPVDAGTDAAAPIDAAPPVDAGGPFDAAVDTGTDASSPVDAGVDTGIDAAIDAALDATIDAAGTPDAGPDAGPLTTQGIITTTRGPSCLACALAHGCVTATQDCESFGATLADPSSTAAGQLRSTLCDNTLSCVLTASCFTANSGGACYCGTDASCLTSGAPAMGPCKQQEYDGLEASDVSGIRFGFTQKTLGGGMANVIVTCLRINACSDCFNPDDAGTP